MRKEDILKIAGEIYDEAEPEIIAALLRIEKIACDTRYEGLLILDELRESMADEEFPAKEYLMLGMEWICCGVETDFWQGCMENLIDVEESPKIKMFAFLYLTGLRCIQTCEPMSVELRQRLLSSIFPIRAGNKLFNVMQEYEAVKRAERKQETGINLLLLHYEVPKDNNLEKALTEMNVDQFKELFKKIPEEDVITMLLISDGPMHRRMISSMSERFLDILENSDVYSIFIREEQINKAIDSWKQQAVSIERGNINE